MGKFLTAALAALALTASPAFGKSQSEPDAPGGGKDKGERRICKTFENTASRMKREKVCLTRQQWKKFEAEQSFH
jgi:hypothetical protein